MKRFRNIVIGGIQNKVFNLILFTVVLLTAAFLAVIAQHSRVLAKLATESNESQQATISEMTSQVMDQSVTQTLERSNRMEARLANELFEAARNRVLFLGDRATELFAHPEDFAPQSCPGPNPQDDGRWTAKVIYADGVDPDAPEVAGSVGLAANLSDVMLSVCPSFEASTMYLGLPEGAHLSVSRESSNWFINGKPLSYDPRGRKWYQQAVQAGGLIFTSGEYDANSGMYCLECAMPVYGPDGGLRAVVGTDIYLDEILDTMGLSSMLGEYQLLINQEGRAVLPTQAEIFPMVAADRTGDLRESQNALLAKVVNEALNGKDTGVSSGRLDGGDYYVIATPIEATGWTLLSAYSQAISDQPMIRLKNSVKQVRAETSAAYRGRIATTRVASVVLLVMVALITLGLALLVSGRIVKPLNTITRRIYELDEDKLEFTMEDTYRTGDEVEALAESFASLSHKTVEYMDRIVKVTAEKERIDTELTLATRIQASMLPHIFPPFPDRADFDIYASMDPAKEVGGDFYDYFLVDDDHLCMVIADVSGKGVPAALFMMASKIILQSVAMMGLSPAKILERTNDAICSSNDAEMFVTVWLGILELSTGRLVAANAGHEYPALKRPDGMFELYKDRHGLVIGGMEGVRYRDYEIQMEPGARLFTYTDGVPEATDAGETLFGTNRMVEALNLDPEAGPEEVLKNVRRAVDDFVKDAEQFDDLTMLCLEYRGKSYDKG